MRKWLKTKKAGVWLDHTKAHLIGMDNGKAVMLETVDSPYDPHLRFEGENSDVTQFRPGGAAVSNNEDRKHNRIQGELEAYYNVLGNRLREFDAILLFGPGIAKSQLQNHLPGDKSFEGKTLAVASSENRLSENQLLAFVRNYFQKLQ